MNTAPKARTSPISRILLPILASGLAITLGGCIHANLPGETTNTLASTDPNSFPAPKLMALSLEYVANRYPPAAGTSGAEPTFAFNLPAGVNDRNREMVAQMLDNRGSPVTAENATRLPIYHISTMWIRGTRAQVELVYPIEAVGMTPGNQPVYRGVSLSLGQDMGPWRVIRQQLWNVGTIEVPPLHFGDEAAPSAPAPAEEPTATPPEAAPEPAAQPEPVATQPENSGAVTKVLPAEQPKGEGDSEPEASPK